MTYSEALEYAEGYLSERGVAESRGDAYLLLSHISGKDRTFFLTHGDETALSEEVLSGFREIIEKRGERIPVQLLTGHTDFMGLDFLVSEKVLIPRIDTEFLVEEAMTEVDDGSYVLDMCTGSGCVLLSLMKYKNAVTGVGADISPFALSLARENAKRLSIENAEFIESDLFSNVEGRFDHILCNPPYIKSEVIDTLMDEVRLHEPWNALDGGEDGLMFYRRIADEASDHLCSGGHLFLEIGYDEGDQVSKILEDVGYRNIRVIKDYSGNERVVRCLKS